MKPLVLASDLYPVTAETLYARLRKNGFVYLDGSLDYLVPQIRYRAKRDGLPFHQATGWRLPGRRFVARQHPGARKCMALYTKPTLDEALAQHQPAVLHEPGEA